MSRRLISEDLRLGEREKAQRTLACALTIAVAAGAVVAVLLEVGQALGFGGFRGLGLGHSNGGVRDALLCCNFKALVAVLLITRAALAACRTF
jgi:hypothetical protein